VTINEEYLNKERQLLNETRLLLQALLFLSDKSGHYFLSGAQHVLFRVDRYFNHNGSDKWPNNIVS
jgi:hypothetical protein